MLLELIRKCSVSNVATFHFILCGTDLNYSRLMSNHKPLISQFFVFVSYLSIFSWRLYGFHGCLVYRFTFSCRQKSFYSSYYSVFPFNSFSFQSSHRFSTLPCYRYNSFVIIYLFLSIFFTIF